MDRRDVLPRSNRRRMAAWGACVALAATPAALRAQLPNPLPALLPPSGGPVRPAEPPSPLSLDLCPPALGPGEPQPMPIVLPTALQLANGAWKEPESRNLKKIEWQSWAQRKYRRLAAAR